jgi:hypothetical protein
MEVHLNVLNGIHLKKEENFDTCYNMKLEDIILSELNQKYFLYEIRNNKGKILNHQKTLLKSHKTILQGSIQISLYT